VWRRFDRLSKGGVFEAFFDALASMSSTAHLLQMFDSTVVRMVAVRRRPQGLARAAEISAARAASFPGGS
jgi:hypothetical protein